MAKLLDFILDHTGAIGARIRGYKLEGQRDSLIMRRPRSPVRTVITMADGKKLTFDAATSLGHDFTSKVTSYPVEDKSTVSDHVVLENPKFTVSGVFSNAAVGVGSTPQVSNQDEIYRNLLKIRDEGKPVTLLTPLDTFTDLIPTRIGFPKQAGQGSALFVDIDFEKVRRVSNELTTVFVGSTAKSGDANKKTTGNTKTNGSETKDAGPKPPEGPIEDQFVEGLVKLLGDVTNGLKSSGVIPK